MTACLLPGITPAFEVFPYRPHGHDDTILLADQVAHGTPRPQRGSDAQVFGGFAVEQLLQVAGLLVAQCASGAEGASRAFVREGVETPLGIGGPPARDGFPGNT